MPGAGSPAGGAARGGMPKQTRDPRAAAAGRGGPPRGGMPGGAPGGPPDAKGKDAKGSPKGDGGKGNDKDKKGAESGGKGKGGKGKGGKGGESGDRAAALAAKAAEQATEKYAQSNGVPAPLAKAAGKVAGKAAAAGVKVGKRAAKSGAIIAVCLLLAFVASVGGQLFGDSAPPAPATAAIQAQIPGGRDGGWVKVLQQAQESTRSQGDYMVPWTVLAGIAKANTDFGARPDVYDPPAATAGAPGAATAGPVAPTAGQSGTRPGTSCKVSLKSDIGGGADQGAGAFLVLPQVAADMAAAGKDPQNVCDSAKWIAQKLSAAAKRVDHAHSPSLDTTKAANLPKFWAAALAEAHLTADPTGTVGDCRLPAGAGDVPVDYEISWVWRCQLSKTAQLHVASDAIRAANGTVAFTEFDRDSAVNQLVNEALTVAYGFSKFTTTGCDPKAAVAGVFPLSKATGTTYGAADRCDRHANILAAAQAVAAVDAAPFDKRHVVPAGDFAPMLGGWSVLPGVLGSSAATFAQRGPYHTWTPAADCQTRMNTYALALLTSPGAPFAPLAADGDGQIPAPLPTPVTAALTAAGAGPVTDPACAGATEDRPSFYAALITTASQVQAPAAGPAIDETSRNGVLAYFASLASANPLPTSTYGTVSLVPRLAPIQVDTNTPPLSDFTQPGGAVPGVDTVIAWASWFGGFGYGYTYNVAMPGASSGSTTGAGTLKPGSVPGPYGPMIVAAVAKYCPQLPVGILAAQLAQESGFRPDASSPVGAQGIAQFMPSTWGSRTPGSGAGVDGDGDGIADPLNPRDAIPAAARYDCAKIAEVAGIPGDPIQLALAAYNAGGGSVHRYGGIPPFTETQHYVQIITANAAKYMLAALIPGAGNAVGCPTTAPANTLRSGSAAIGIAQLCASSVAQAATPQAAAAIKWGLSQMGFYYSQPLRMAADHFDCSSFVSRAYRGAGVDFIKLNGNWAPTTKILPFAGYTEQIPWAKARPGDLVLPSTGHVVMLLADGYIVHYNQDGDIGHVERVYWSSPVYTLRVHPERVPL